MKTSLKIAILYVVVGILWIFASDTLILYFFQSTDVSILTNYQSFKGTAFIFLTGILLYYLMEKQYLYLDSKVKELEKANLKIEKERIKSDHAKNQLDQFISVASNELVEPVRQSHGFLELFIRKNKNSLPEKSISFLELTLDNFYKIKDVIQDLVEFSQLTEEREALQIVDLNEVLEKAIHLNSRKFGVGKIDLKKEDLPSIKGDYKRFLQLFDQLLNNAFNFRDSSRPLKIEISVSKADGFQTIAVKDNGVGIASQNLDSIFYILQQYDQGLTRRGSGMGLAICKKIIEDGGGKIWATSVLGEGSTIHFTVKDVVSREKV
ncbi:sensor histidine kinase [Cyclobacterium plantarum]|uniref:histidine kinase n=1 Tax=Cyclobacterium plantarum TaxID=2716263 RepID=A0ABX0HGJ4_9BACT|nr:ATP-binding protein [Cyclobacterium plantarum]NHE59717.1 hypothetical protein [Cyclobacterium plantarum]